MQQPRKRPSNPPSVASSASASSSSSGIDSAVTKLLVSTKTLLESLTQWSLGATSDDRISDVYVDLGNNFNSVCSVFARERISMKDLLSIPDDLRICLETCLSSEEASPATLEQYLPQIKSIIVRLLQGLKAKQAQHKATLERKRGIGNAPVQKSSSRQASAAPSLPASSFPTHNKSMPSQGSLNGLGLDTGELPYPTHSRGSSRSGHSPQPSTSSARATPPPRPAVLPKSNSVTSDSTASSSTSPPKPPAIELPKLEVDPVPNEPIKMPPPILGASPSASFESLKNSDNLARRASKRFSRYTLDKMTGSPSRTDISDAARKYPRSPPQMPHLSNGGPYTPTKNGSQSNLSLLAPSPQGSSLPLPRGETYLNLADAETRKSISEESQASDVSSFDLGKQQKLETVQEGTPSEQEETPTLDPRGPPPSAASFATFSAASPDPTARFSHTAAQLSPRQQQVALNAEPLPPLASTSIFVNFGRETKKVVLEPDQIPPTIASLRVIFMDKFSFNPGQEDFPAIYIRDPRVGVEYELEDASEVKDGCVLSLNIEPLDQVKQHIDSGLSTLSRDIKDLKTSLLSAVRRSSIPPPAAPVSFAATSPTSIPAETSKAAPAPQLSLNPDQLPTSPTVVSKIVADVRGYFDEVQHVRRDLAVLRQIYADYTTQHKEVLSALRSQVTRVKTLAGTQPSAARAFIEAGKKKLDSRSQDLLTKVEALMDTVENMRDDVTVRRMRPVPGKLEELRKEIDASLTEMQDLGVYINTVRPSWKKTWSNELQNVVEEERFLKHQEEMLHELAEDHRDLSDMFGIIDELMKKQPGSQGPRFSGRSGLKEYIPPEPDANHEGLATVLSEVKSLAVDPDKRLRAIEEAERARDKQLAERKGDAFAQELGGFVEGKMLKKTGGAEEADRIRRMKSEATLRNLYAKAQETELPDSPQSPKPESHLPPAQADPARPSSGESSLGSS